MGEEVLLKTVQRSIEENNITLTIIIASLLVLYVIIQKVYDYYKHRNELVITREMTDSIYNILESIKDISSSISSISLFLTRFTDNILVKDKEKCRIAIRLAFGNLEKELFIFGRNIIIANNLDVRREHIVESVGNYVESQYYELYSVLANFEVNDKKVNHALKNEWKEELRDAVISGIFDYRNGITLTSHIDILSEKITTLVDGYKTYIHNKIFAD